jgi:hypothetical protein
MPYAPKWEQQEREREGFTLNVFVIWALLVLFFQNNVQFGNSSFGSTNTYTFWRSINPWHISRTAPATSVAVKRNWVKDKII